MGLLVKTFSSGEVIIKEGDMGRSIFRLIEGTVDVFTEYGTKDQFRLAVLNAGDYFGEMAMFEEYPRSATVEARGNVRVLEIPENELNSFMSENPDVIFELMTHLGNKVRAMTNDYNESLALLKELREADAGKKKSLFSKIKKHINAYQNNKNVIEESGVEPAGESADGITIRDTDNISVYENGNVIFSEGESSNCMYLLHSGKAGIYEGDTKVSELIPVSVFGEMGMIFGDPRNATAVAEEDDTKVEIITQEDLEYVFKVCPAKINLILRYMSNCLRKLNSDFISTCKEITETYGD